jgi:hypothetical protein
MTVNDKLNTSMVFVVPAAVLLFAASHVSAEPAKAVAKPAAAPAKSVAKTSSAKISLSGVKVLTATTATPSTPLQPNKPKAPSPVTVNFELLRPDLAKLLGVAESAVPSPLPAQDATQVGNMVTVSLLSVPPGATIGSADCGFGMTRLPDLQASIGCDNQRTEPHFNVTFSLPIAPEATYLVTCYTQIYYGPKSLTYEFAEHGLSARQTAPVNDGLLVAAYRTTKNASRLTFSIFYDIGSNASFHHCDVMRVK